MKLSRNGIFIGTPRKLDVTWRRWGLTFRTYRWVLRVWPRPRLERAKW